MDNGHIRSVLALVRTWWLVGLLVLLQGCALVPGYGQSPRDITAEFSSLRLDAADPRHPERVLAGEFDARFSRPPRTHGLYTHADALWYQATLSSASLSGHEWVLELPYNLYSLVDIWFEDESGMRIQHQAGLSRPLLHRAENTPTLAFPVPARPQGDLKVVLRIVSGAPLLFTPKLWEREAWDAFQRRNLAWYGLLFGSIAVLLLYNSFLAIALKDNSYIFYMLYLISMTLVIFDISGLRAQYTDMPDRSLSYLGFAAAFAMAFCNRFLGLRTLFPWGWRTSTAVVLIIAGISTILLFPRAPFSVTQGVLLILSLSGIATLYYVLAPTIAYFQGMRQARFLILAFSAIAVSFYWYILRLFGLAHIEASLSRTVEVGLLAEAVLLSLALADRINLIDRAKERAEREALLAQQRFSKQIIKTQEQERESLSQMLHDAIGHGLLVLKQNLEFLRDRGCDKQRAGESLPSAIHQCTELLNDVRSLSHDLHPHLLRRLGLAAAIESILDRAFSPREMDWVAQVSVDENHLSDEQKIALYRVVQEAVNNVLKHANAQEVIVRVSEQDKQVVLDFKDDGSGFDMAEIANGGIGFNTMRGRVELLNGWFRAHSAPDQGTHVEIGIPLR